MSRLEYSLESKLTAFAQALVDQSRARVIVSPQRPGTGYWFGGGNLIEHPQGTLFLVGRFRNQGDSRSGLAAGERGLELTVFSSQDGGATFQKRLSFSKADLSQPGREVLSIEGSALHWTQGGVELFVSSEKAGIGYPAGLETFLKPGCGIWTIERLQAVAIDELPTALAETVFESDDPEHLHCKDPRCYDSPAGDLLMMFCSHPFSWSSSNTALALRRRGKSGFDKPQYGVFPRGTTWDVAITRGTCLLDVPRMGPFCNRQVTLLFYDGGESLRNLDEHAAAVKRPRGYSCEELGGLAYVVNGEFHQIHRLSTTLPLLTSPHGTGCSRYVDILMTGEGYYATWQQSQPDFSQPLVMNFLGLDDVERILA